MKKLSVLLCLLAPAIALAQVQVHVALPVIQFEAPPPLVVVSPGIQVVPDYEEEVFFVNGWYWVRRDTYWFRARDYRGGWAVAERRHVPAGLVRIPYGHYKRWHAAGPVVPSGGHGGQVVPSGGHGGTPVMVGEPHGKMKFKGGKGGKGGGKHGR